MTHESQALTVRPTNGFRPTGYRIVHFCIRGDIFNRAKAKATIHSLSLADYVAALMERDTIALAQLAEEEEQLGSP